MDFLDSIVQQATDVATTVVERTRETARLGQLQIQLRALKSEQREALAALGREAEGLYRDEMLAEGSTEFVRLADVVKEATAKVAAKEAEIAELRESEAPPTGADTVEGEAEEVADAAGETPPSEPPEAG